MSDRQALIARLRLALDFAAPRAWCEIGEDVVCECITALEEAQGVPREPDGYAYEYEGYHGRVIRMSHGEEYNGSKPLRAIPYWLDAAPAAPTREPVSAATLRDEQDAKRYRHIRCLSVPQFADLFMRNLRGEGAFDDLVDAALAEPKR